MFRYLWAIMLMVASVSPAMATDAFRADANYGVKYNTSELVLDLPQDGDKLYVTVFGDEKDTKYQKINSWFNTDAELVALKNQSHFTAIPTNSAMFKERYSATVPQLPCIRVQSSDGRPIYELSGNEIPLSAESLLRNLNSSETFRAEGILRRSRICPYRQPVTPCTPPAIPSDPTPTPLNPPVAPRKPTEQIPWLLLGVLSAAGVVAGAWKHFSDVAAGRK